MEIPTIQGTALRRAGILLHPTSFPGPYGIGDLGPNAYEFIDFLKFSGIKLWEVLPLGHTGFADSPYQTCSAFAGNPYLISPDHLKELALLSDKDFEDMMPWNPENIDYGNAISFKTVLLKTAFKRFIDSKYKDNFSSDPGLMKEYEDFKSSTDWLMDYSLFMAIKDYHDKKPWYLWEDSIKNSTEGEKNRWKNKLKNEIEYYNFIQFLFYIEWKALKKYANNNGIDIIGDIPFYIGWDSVDVWNNQNLFKLDTKGYPTVVAGVPPDYFSQDGQLWGNPLYNWDEHVKTGYEWWERRFRHHLKLYDYLRVDHFRGFVRCWGVPYGCDNARGGSWFDTPGESLFTTIEASLGFNLPLIADDLGRLEIEVSRLREKYDFPGMRVLQFAFEEPNENVFMPHNHIKNCVCYTGTHDNDTSLGWYKHAYETSRDKLRRYYSTDASDVSWVMIRGAFGSVADMSIVLLQDVLSLDSWARYNTPGSSHGNWCWRYKKDALTPELSRRLYETTKLYGR